MFNKQLRKAEKMRGFRDSILGEVLKALNREKLAQYEMFRRYQFYYNYLCVPKYVRIVPHVVNKKGSHVIMLKDTKNIKLNLS